MTRARYYLLRFGQTFGIQFTTRHSTAAAAEVHLLREAEEILGALCWQELEDMEEISMEYWNLRKFVKERDLLIDKIATAQETLTASHTKRSAQLERVVDRTKDLVDEREEVIEKNDRLNAERELVLGEARSVKRRHDGIKAKLEVLTEEGKSKEPIFEQARDDLLELKKRFKKLRTSRDELTEKIDALDKKTEGIDEKISARRADIQSEESDNFGAIGQANKDISQNRAKLGVLETEMNVLFSEIGRYLATHHRAPGISEVARPHRSLIAQISLLRNSVQMNRMLANR